MLTYACLTACMHPTNEPLEIARSTFILQYKVQIYLQPSAFIACAAWPCEGAAPTASVIAPPAHVQLTICCIPVMAKQHVEEGVHCRRQMSVHMLPRHRNLQQVQSSSRSVPVGIDEEAHTDTRSTCAMRLTSTPTARKLRRKSPESLRGPSQPMLW